MAPPGLGCARLPPPMHRAADSMHLLIHFTMRKTPLADVRVRVNYWACLMISFVLGWPGGGAGAHSPGLGSQERCSLWCWKLEFHMEGWHPRWHRH